MLPLRHQSLVERRLNRHATTIIICGLFLTVCGALFLAMCKTPCDNTVSLQTRASSLELKTHLVIVVMTGPQNRHQRDTIRQTWLADSPLTSTLLKFVIGTEGLAQDVQKAVDREQFIHNDLVLLNSLTESYHNLTRKLLWSFLWLDRNVQFKFVLKVDDDSFVRVGPLLRALRQQPQERLYWGFFNGRAHVKKTGKWAERDWFLCDRYLPYALGGGYILSSDLVQYVARNSDLLQLYRSEDISLGTWLAPLHIQRVHDQRFDTEFVSRGCQNSYLVTHKQSAMDMQQLNVNLHKFGDLCLQEKVRRESYVYNWSVLPSLCCPRNDKFLIKD